MKKLSMFVLLFIICISAKAQTLYVKNYTPYDVNTVVIADPTKADCGVYTNGCYTPQNTGSSGTSTVPAVISYTLSSMMGGMSTIWWDGIDVWDATNGTPYTNHVNLGESCLGGRGAGPLTYTPISSPPMTTVTVTWSKDPLTGDVTVELH
jgi:hypothetical protein